MTITKLCEVFNAANLMDLLPPIPPPCTIPPTNAHLFDESQKGAAGDAVAEAGKEVLSHEVNCFVRIVHGLHGPDMRGIASTELVPEASRKAGEKGEGWMMDGGWEDLQLLACMIQAGNEVIRV